MAKKAAMTDLSNSFFDGMLEAARAKGETDIICGDLYGRDVGIPLPALSLRYLFKLTAIPLSRVMQITGQAGSAKSAFLFDVMRMFLTHGGGVSFAENELKDATMLRSSILEWNQKYINRVYKKETSFMEEWQMFLTQQRQLVRSMMDKRGGPGRSIPILLCVDSFTGTPSKAVSDQIDKDGHSSKHYADAAFLLTDYMRSVPNALKGYPILMAGTNHLKPGTDAMGRPSPSVPGGKGVKFEESFEVEMSKSGTINLKDYSGIRVKFHMRKNSMGETGATMEANLLWADVDTPEFGMRQMTQWDWHTASIDLIQSCDAQAWLKKELKEASGIEIVSKSLKLACSDMLGVPKTAPVSFHTLGLMLESNLEVLERLYKVLGINPVLPFVAGDDYLKKKEEAGRMRAAVVASRYSNISQLPVLATQAPLPPGFDLEEADVTPESEAPANVG